jgi:hypothetical protein
VERVFHSCRPYGADVVEGEAGKAERPSVPGAVDVNILACGARSCSVAECDCFGEDISVEASDRAYQVCGS